MPPLDFGLSLGGKGKRRSSSDGSKFQFHGFSLSKQRAYDSYVTNLLNTQTIAV
jgi:hypothetical protein